jgi:hypothetical protein
MQFIDSFIKRKHGEEKITYLHEGMKNSLANTYGILVYQEQFMQISKEWCGFTGGQADTLRKAVGKKKIDLMRKVKVDFVNGAIEHGGATKEVAETFWAQLEEFANYCFNKSHAACYALIAYWTAYLKAHYPDAFMAAVMTSDHDDIDRLAGRWAGGLEHLCGHGGGDDRVLRHVQHCLDNSQHGEPLSEFGRPCVTYDEMLERCLVPMLMARLAKLAGIELPKPEPVTFETETEDEP